MRVFKVLLGSLGHSFFAAWWLCPTLIIGAGAAASPPALDISELESRHLRAPVEHLTVDDRLSLEEVQRAGFEPLTDDDVNVGISDNRHWLRFRLRNDSDKPRQWLLHNDTSYLDHLVIHYRDGETGDFAAEHLSDRQPFHTRQIDYRYLTFSHQTPAHSYTDVYVEAWFEHADSMSLNFKLWDAPAFWANARQENLIYGGFYGILLILTFISLTFALLLKQVNALYYAGYLACTAGMWLLLNGYAFQYLWPTSVYWHNEGFHVSFLLFAFFSLQFSKTFLCTRSFQPKVHRALSGLQIVIIGGLLLRALGVYEAVLHLSFAMLLALALVIPWASWRSYRRGLDYARWYTPAWLVYSLSLVACILSAWTDFLQWGMKPLAFMQAGVLLEAVFLLIAMSDWLLSLDTDRRRAIALANQDPLTGLGNRRVLQIRYEHFREQFTKGGQPVFLIMLDLDHFKSINDSFGHEAGDRVLQDVAALIKRLSRDDDECIRYGGEEFAILLPADSLDAVWQVAERIRTEFAEQPTTYQGDTIRHTLSSGITQVLSEDEMLSVSEMMRRADAALYRGKSAGRNRNTLYTAEEDAGDTVASLPASQQAP